MIDMYKGIGKEDDSLDIFYKEVRRQCVGTSCPVPHPKGYQAPSDEISSRQE